MALCSGRWSLAHLLQVVPTFLILFYKPVRINDAVVFDPFMGSGTTIGEALKLGVRGGSDAISTPSLIFLFGMRYPFTTGPRSCPPFRAIERDVADKLRRFYRTILPDGTEADVLYFFWVKTADCPACAETVDLFASYIFARHAYPRRFPEAQALCPSSAARLTKFVMMPAKRVATDAGLSSIRRLAPTHGTKGNLLCL